MTRIDFYLLKSSAPSEREKMACRLTEKAMKRGHNVYLHCGSQKESDAMDNLLWSFRPGSFVPHEQLNNGENPAAPILLGHQTNPELAQHDILINLSREQPSFFSRFERVIEIIDDNSEIKEAGRNRYRFYKNKGYPLQTHEL